MDDHDYDDPDPDYDRDDYDRIPAPDFGCACEDALVVDMVCQRCIEWLQERDEEVARNGQRREGR